MVFEGAQTAPPFKSGDQLRLNPTHRSLRGKPKGQLISEWIFGVFKSPKKPTKFFDRFLPYEARAEICQKCGWLFGRFEDTENSFRD